MTDPVLEARLDAGLAAMSLTPEAPARARLLSYLGLLAQWNRVYNLTAVREPAQWISLHLLDSLSLRPFLPPGRLLDIGSGAGLPGLVIAMLEPDRDIVLLDSNAKKTRFLTQAVTTLQLKNVKVARCRIEAYQPAALFDAVTSRAFAALSDFVRSALPLCRPADGILLAMKGRYPAEELQDLPAGVRLNGVHRVEVPGLDAERHIVSMTPIHEC